MRSLCSLERTSATNTKATPPTQRPAIIQSGLGRIAVLMNATTKVSSPMNSTTRTNRFSRLVNSKSALFAI